MLLELDHHSGVPIYRQIIRQIRQQIMTDGLKTGDQLATVRDLAAQLNVNPMTVSKAYSFLEVQGLVERRRGIGLFVAKIKKRQKQQIKTDLFSEIVNQAAVTALQLEIPEEQAVESFVKHYRQHNNNQR